MDKWIVNSPANRWILICSTISYEQKLRCLRLSLYPGMDDLLFFHKFSSSNYDCNIYNHATSCPINSITIRQKSRKVFLITKLKREKNLLFINLATYLAVDLALLDYESFKEKLTKVHGKFFAKRYAETDPCTLRIICACNCCIKSKVLTIS